MEKKHVLLGDRAADNFRNAADEAKNRSGYGTTSNYGRSNSTESTTEKIKDKAGEFAQQAKSAVRIFSNGKYSTNVF